MQDPLIHAGGSGRGAVVFSSSFTGVTSSSSHTLTHTAFKLRGGSTLQCSRDHMIAFRVWHRVRSHTVYGINVLLVESMAAIKVRITCGRAGRRTLHQNISSRQSVDISVHW